MRIVIIVEFHVRIDVQCYCRKITQLTHCLGHLTTLLQRGATPHARNVRALPPRGRAPKVEEEFNWTRYATITKLRALNSSLKLNLWNKSRADKPVRSSGALYSHSIVTPRRARVRRKDVYIQTDETQQSEHPGEGGGRGCAVGQFELFICVFFWRFGGEKIKTVHFLQTRPLCLWELDITWLWLWYTRQCHSRSQDIASFSLVAHLIAGVWKGQKQELKSRDIPCGHPFLTHTFKRAKRERNNILATAILVTFAVHSRAESKVLLLKWRARTVEQIFSSDSKSATY